ncbi:hypothetical protein GW17_00050753 [Ensete ventricosum]|nr:hypothetical protein GW17_00050753 [Ensete ventricosum]
MHRVDAIWNSLGVHWELVEGIGSLLGWHKGVCQKKIETRRKIVWGSRKAYRELEDSPQEYRRLPDWREYFRQLTHPGSVGKLPVPWCSGG